MAVAFKKTRYEHITAEATLRQKAGIPFRGVIYAHQLRVAIGTYASTIWKLSPKLGNQRI